MFRSRKNSLSLVTVLVYGFLYLPIIVLIVFSFNASRINASWTGFTIQWYRALMADSGIQQALSNSVSVSLAATALATITGTFAAHGLQRSRMLQRSLFSGFVYLPLIIPDIVIGVALVMLYVSVHLELGIMTLVLSHLVFDSSYVTIIVLSRLRVYDPKIEEAAMDLGATPLKIFFTIRLPLILPAVIAAALLAFTLSFDDFLISFMTSGVGTTTLPIKIYSMTRFGVSPMINALSTLIILFTATSIIIVHLLIMKTNPPGPTIKSRTLDGLATV